MPNLHGVVHLLVLLVFALAVLLLSVVHKLNYAAAPPEILLSGIIKTVAPVAQRIERLPPEEEVGGSNPFGRANTSASPIAVIKNA